MRVPARVPNAQAPVTAQSVTNDEPEYQMELNNDTSSAVTVNGFAITISAFGSTIGNDSPSVNPALMEPTETWKYGRQESNPL